MNTEYIDLVTDSGEIVRIECPMNYSDQCYESIENAMKRRDWWSPARFEGCSATYLGLLTSRVAMWKIVATL